ncbi:MAG: glycosyltransferase [bacterium]|nr:glycosyltransferase [bacterium]
MLILWHGALYPSYRKPFWLLQTRWGWDVHLITAKRWTQCMPRKTTLQPAEAEPIHVHTPAAVAAWHGALYCCPTFPFLFNRIKPDLVFAIEEPFSIMGWLATYWCARHVPPIPSILYSYQNIAKPYPQPFRGMETFVLENSCRILVSETGVGRVLERKGYEGMWDVLGLGVDLDRFKYRAPRKQIDFFTLGYVGRLANEKGIQTLLWALMDLPDYVRLHLAGDGPARHRLETMARELGVYHRVAFRGAIAHDDLPAFYHEIDALVLPSVTTPGWKEQFGRVLIEAMACGRPVIGSDSGAIPEVLGEEGLIFPEKNVEELAKKIAFLYDDFHLQQTLSLRGRVRVEQQYSAERCAQKLNDHFIEVLSSACRD